MPRPKVRPEDRLRSSKACSACKSSKIRCNSELPCLSCVKRGRPNACEYSHIDRRRRQRDTISSPVTRIGGDRSPATSTQYDESSQCYNVSASSAAVSDMSPASAIRTPPSSCGNAVQKQTSQPAIHSVGGQVDEQVYTGEAESLSFMFFLRKTLRPFIGTSRFTDNEPQQVGSFDEPSFGSVESHAEMSVEQTYALLNSYFEATSGVLDLFTADEIDALVAERATQVDVNSLPESRRDDLASLNVALAIAAQSLSIPKQTSSSYDHATFFRQASQVAFHGMLASPSLPMVRLFLLMSFYMLGACNRAAAAMYLGIASKAAEVLGLHGHQRSQEGHSDCDDARCRIVKSLTVMNVLSRFILGRRDNTSTGNMPLKLSEPSTMISPTHGASIFSAIYEGCSHIEAIVQSLRTGNILHVHTAERLLEQLRRWIHSSRGPTQHFVTYPTGELNPEQQQALMGRIHLSCVYYFAVMLVTRPFLIAYLLSRLRGRAPDHLIDDPDEARDVTIKNNKVSKMAQVCVSSATCMVESLRKAKRSGYAFGNLCLIKAWLFGSGLVLGFSMFAGEPRVDIQEAFEGAGDILKDMSETSPQARIYHAILTDFSEAVAKYRQRVAHQIKKTVDSYLDSTPFFSIAPSGSDQRPSSAEGLLSSEDCMSLADADLQINWADLDLYLIDNSLLSPGDTFEGLFYSVD